MYICKPHPHGRGKICSSLQPSSTVTSKCIQWIVYIQCVRYFHKIIKTRDPKSNVKVQHSFLTGLVHIFSNRQQKQSKNVHQLRLDVSPRLPSYSTFVQLLLIPNPINTEQNEIVRSEGSILPEQGRRQQ